ncbi:MarR family winged helix-turn-helix transcriptional regulator [Frateuria aurantia]
MNLPPPPPSELAFQVADALRGIVRTLKRRLREQAPTGDLSPSQTAVLLRLESDGPATTSALARAEGMRPQSMAPIIAALERLGFLHGQPDPDDGRQTLHSLTPACKAWLAEGRAARQDWLSRRLQQQLSAAELGQLEQAIALLRRLTTD